MRIIRRPEQRQRDELEGTFSPRPLIPTISRRSKQRFASGILRPESMSLGYVSWMAFLVFWIVFGRVTVLYSMTMGGLVQFPAAGGVSLALQGERLEADQLDQLIAGELVVGEDGPFELNTDHYTVHHVRVQADGVLQIEAEVWSSTHMQELCADHEETGRTPVVFLTVNNEASYQVVVSALDKIRTASPAGCPLDLRLSRSRP